MLTVEELTLIKSQSRILNGISLKIPQGRTTLLLGKSGSGKTSLLRCLAQLQKTDSGQILYNQTPVTCLSTKQRCQTIGYVPQAYPLFPHMNALENCAQPCRMLLGMSKQDAREQAINTLSLFGMKELAMSLPSCLSGGQQQRVAIARALCLNPLFLLFDEPTSALDPVNTEQFLSILNILCAQGKGVIIATQDMGFALKALDVAYFLEDGNLSESFDAAAQTSLPSSSKLMRFLQCFP